MMLVGFPELYAQAPIGSQNRWLRWMIQTHRSKHENSELDYHRFAVAGRRAYRVPVITILYPLVQEIQTPFAVAHKIFSPFLSSWHQTTFCQSFADHAYL